jgi:sugar phosphate isomerase/epimerase
MDQSRIGVFADCLRLPVREGLAKAAELGAGCFQIFTTGEKLIPRPERAHFRKFYTGLGLQLSALCSDFGHGFVDVRRNRELIPQMREQVDLAAELEVPVITTHIGTLTDGPGSKAWAACARATADLGAYARKHGVVLAAETGPEPGPVMRKFLDAVEEPGVRVNFDPANFIIYGFDLWEGLAALSPLVVHTHAKDAVSSGGGAPCQGREVPLGRGEVDWPRYLAALSGAGYRGPLVIEREVGPDPVGDTKAAIEFLKGL